MRLWILPGIIGIFLCISTITLSSIMPSLAGRQLVFFLLALIAFFAVSRVSFSRLLEYRVPAYSIACLSLLIPFVFSMTTRGTARWIQVADGIALQPSQFTFPLISFALIWVMSQGGRDSWKKLMMFFALLLVPTAIIAGQPDLDTAIVLLISLGSLVFFTPTSWKKLAVLTGSIVITAVFAWFFVLQPYQKDRIFSFIDAQSGQEQSYNAQQALIAVGSGGVFGVGLGQGTQSHLRFLPERHTDFIFASLAEEYGLVGTMLVLSVYVALTTFLVWSARSVQHGNEQLFLLAAAVMFGMQASINIGMNVGLLPIAGITLPLLSYGGSAVIGQAVILGIAQSIIRNTQRTSRRHLA
ncbi:MAG: FtsW/RodA/SpoVE family cell cycle protein [Patescibacteria group bacterium]